MAFVEIVKITKDPGKLAVDATYHINNQGRGILRFTLNGVEKLNKIAATDNSRTFKLFIDKSSKSLAFKLTDEGHFKFSGLLNKEAKFSCRDLTNSITEKLGYLLKESKQYSFVLEPVKENTQNASSTIEQKGVVETPSQTDVPTATNKPRGKKK
ncbi:MAG: hypothetical protein WAQ98_08340 [Blastocatellia bacterium]